MKFNSIEQEIIYNKLIKGLSVNASDEKMYLNQHSTDQGSNIYLSQIYQYIDIMVKTKENPAYRYLKSHRKFIGQLVTFIKKVVRKSLKWYIEPITNQQTEFNNAVAPAIGRIAELTTRLINKTEDLTKSSEYETNIKLKLEQIEEKSNLIDQFQEKYVENDLKMKQLEAKIASLESTNAIYTDQIDAANTKLNALYELDILIDEGSGSSYVRKSYSQSGEDSIVNYIIRVLGISYDTINYIDLGANHAKEMSNTFYLYQQGAKGILVEANPQLIPELKFYRHNDVILNKCVDIQSDKEVEFYIMSGDGLSTPNLDAAIEFSKINTQLSIIEKVKVKTISYNDIVENYLGKAPTVLSIDVEGKDMEIIESIDFEKYRPLIVIAEMISFDTTLAHNSKNEEIKKFMIYKGYDEYAFTGINSIFIDREFLNERKKKDL